MTQPCAAACLCPCKAAALQPCSRASVRLCSLSPLPCTLVLMYICTLVPRPVTPAALHLSVVTLLWACRYQCPKRADKTNWANKAQYQVRTPEHTRTRRVSMHAHIRARAGHLRGRPIGHPGDRQACRPGRLGRSRLGHEPEDRMCEDVRPTNHCKPQPVQDDVSGPPLALNIAHVHN